MAKITTDKSGVEAMVASMTKQIEQMDIQAIAAAAKKTQDGLAINSFGTAGTFGTMTSCFGTAGTFGCAAQDDVLESAKKAK